MKSEVSVLIGASSETTLQLLSSSCFCIHVTKASEKVDKYKLLGSLQG